MEWRYILLLSVLIAIQSGCRALSPNSADSPFEKIASSLQGNPQNELENKTGSNSAVEPSKMVIVWKENILQADSGQLKQGFTGRIYFYDPAGENVQVAGELNVYGYDDSGAVKKSVPEKHFVFEADKLASHYAPTELGHSYSIWIPWCDYGGYRKAITLVPVFKCANNKIVQGAADYLSLSGQPRKGQTLERTIATQQPQGWSQQPPTAGYENQDAHNYQQQSVRQPQTIPVPQSITDEWNRAAVNQQLTNARSLIPTNPVTMNLLDQAEQNVNGHALNQVHLRNQQINGPLSQQPMYQHSQTNYPQPQRRTNLSDANNGSFNNPMYDNSPGVRAALSDSPQEIARPSVFGRPGSIR